MYFHWENGFVLCYRQIIDFKSQISGYNDTPNECCILNPQLWKLHFVRYQNQHRCSVTDGELDHPSVSLWTAQTSLRGICVRHWQSWDRWMCGGHALHTQCVTPGSSAKDSLWKHEEATSFCAPGPPLCVTYIRWRVLLKNQSLRAVIADQAYQK